jgi:multidrug resistance efflux pump
MSRARAASLLVALAVGCGSDGAGAYAGFLDSPVAAIASPVAGRISAVPVHEGDRVHAGDVLVQLDAVERAAAVHVAESTVAHAETVLDQATREAQAVEPTVLSARAEIARAQAELDDATAELARMQTLAAARVTTGSQLDAARARFAAAQAAVDGGSASRRAARARVLAAFSGVASARAALETARASLELARVQRDEATIRAPFDGIVAECNVREGEWAAPGTPVVSLEDTSEVWARIDVEETAMTRVRVGAPSRVRVVAFPDRWLDGHVIEVGAEGEFAIDRDVRRGRPDVRTFRVRVLLDAPSPELRPGMTADVDFPIADGDAS